MTSTNAVPCRCSLPQARISQMSPSVLTSDLNMAAETGLIGFSTYVFLWGLVFWQTWRATRRAGGLLRGVAIGLLGTWTHLTVHNFLDNLYVNNVHLHIGVMLGVLAFVIRQTERQVEGQDLKR